MQPAMDWQPKLTLNLDRTNMQAQVKILKPVDSPEKPAIIAPVADRDYWIEVRHAKLIELAAIEKRLGIIYQRCPTCNKRNRIEG